MWCQNRREITWFKHSKVIKLSQDSTCFTAQIEADTLMDRIICLIIHYIIIHTDMHALVTTLYRSEWILLIILELYKIQWEFNTRHKLSTHIWSNTLCGTSWWHWSSIRTIAELPLPQSLTRIQSNNARFCVFPSTTVLWVLGGGRWHSIFQSGVICYNRRRQSEVTT